MSVEGIILEDSSIMKQKKQHLIPTLMDQAPTVASGSYRWIYDMLAIFTEQTQETMQKYWKNQPVGAVESWNDALGELMKEE